MHNPHAHIVASFRPMVRLGAYNWLLGKELRTDLDGSEGCLAMRKILAEVTTRVMKDAGIHHEYTHLSNLDRGLAALPQEPLTKAQSEAVLRGAPVAQLMTRTPKTIGPGKLAAEAAQLMDTHKIHALLVVDGDGRVVGALNIHDLLRAGVV